MMDGCDGVNVRLQFGCDALVNFPFLGMSSNSMPDRVSEMAPFSPIFGYGWDPLNRMEHLQSSSLVSSSQYGNGNGNPQLQQHPFLENEDDYSLAKDQSVSDFLEDPWIFSAMIGLFGVSEGQTYCSNWEGDPIGEAAKSSPKERRKKRGADENEEWKGDPSENGIDVPNKKDEKKQKIEGDPGVNSGSKQEDDRKTSGTSKPNYIHARREKISKRTRVLQELVPRCSKITGKAVMLNEIINHVQSLQQQVEFLSMKLARVSPGITVGLERAVFKHVM